MLAVTETRNPARKTKKLLGGWRNKLTGLLYYNASTQTKKRGRNGQELRDRTTQTVLFVDKFTSAKQDAKTQVELGELNVNDRIIRPRCSEIDCVPLKDSDSDAEIKSAIKIQRFYREYRAKKQSLESRPLSSFINEPSEELPGAYKSSDFVILNRSAPKTRGDFELLYNLLDRWRIFENERTRNNLFESSRAVLSSLILSKEVELLRAIDSMKSIAKRKRRERNYRKFLDELSKPIPWKNSRGEMTLVETPRVLRAREYRNLYLLLKKTNSFTLERVNLLYQLKNIALTRSCKHSKELIHLIDQELGLLTLRVDGSHLDYLRDRLKMTFLRLTRDILENEFEEYDKWLGWFDSPSKKLCKNCGRLLSLEKFPDDGSTCNYCLYLRTSKNPRVVYEPYVKILRDIRRSESKHASYTSLAFAIGPEIIYQLVNDIWHGKSAISESDNFDDLKLVRLYTNIKWSPWNCLLLTTKEAAVHRLIEDPEHFYGTVMMQKFRTRNLQAKVQFQSTLGVGNKCI